MQKNVGLNSLHLFCGVGGGVLGDLLLGHRIVGAVEIETYPRKVLLARQLDGSLPRFPIWDDVKTFREDNPDTKNYIEWLQGIKNELIISGGFPCQDISITGKGAGITGERSGLWKEMLRIIREVRPRFAFVENVPALLSRGIDTVLGDLAEIGYDAEWCVLGADDVGANHHRKRIWILAYPTGERGWATTGEPLEGTEKKIDIESECICEDVPVSTGERLEGRGVHLRLGLPLETEADTLGICENVSDTLGEHDDGTGHGAIEVCGERSEEAEILGDICNTNSKSVKRIEIGRTERQEPKAVRGWWSVEPDVGRVANGIPSRVDRLKGLGNAQVPFQMAAAFQILYARITHEHKNPS